MNIPKKSPHLDVLVSTAITFIILGILSFIFFNTKFLNPIYNSLKDFQSTDLYFSQYKSKSTALNKDVILVNIGDADRQQIAASLAELVKYKPKVIGLDVCFPERGDYTSDSALKAVLNHKNIVLASQFHYENNSKDPELVSTNDFFELSDQEGFGNFLGGSSSTVRYFAPFAELDTHRLMSFSTKILQIAYPEHFETLQSRKNKTEIINYRDENFLKIHIDDVIGNTQSTEFYEDKVILMGYMGDKSGRKVMEDLHVTPLNKSVSGVSVPDMYGVEIHAHSIAMMMNNEYINEVSYWLSVLIAVIICALHMYIFIFLFVKKHLWFHTLAKLIQLISFGLLFSLSIMVFHYFNLKIEPSLLLIGIIIAVDALYFAELLMMFLHKKFKVSTYFESH